MFWFDIKTDWLHGKNGNDWSVRIHFLRCLWQPCTHLVKPFLAPKMFSGLFCQMLRWHPVYAHLHFAALFHPFFYLFIPTVDFVMSVKVIISVGSPVRPFPKTRRTSLEPASQNTPCLLKAHSSVSSDVLALHLPILHLTFTVFVVKSITDEYMCTFCVYIFEWSVFSSSHKLRTVSGTWLIGAAVKLSANCQKVTKVIEAEAWIWFWYKICSLARSFETGQYIFPKDSMKSAPLQNVRKLHGDQVRRSLQVFEPKPWVVFNGWANPVCPQMACIPGSKVTIVAFVWMRQN